MQRQRAERGPELPGPPAHLISGRPQDPDPGLHKTPGLRDGQFRLRGERQLPRDPGSRPPLRVPAQQPGMYTSKSTHACPSAVTWLCRSVLTPVIGESRIQLLINGRCYVSGMSCR